MECVLCLLFAAGIVRTFERYYLSEEESLLSYWDKVVEAVTYLFAQITYGAQSESNHQILGDNWEFQGYNLFPASKMSLIMPFAVIPNENATVALKLAYLKYVPSLEFSEVVRQFCVNLSDTAQHLDVIPGSSWFSIMLVLSCHLVLILTLSGTAQTLPPPLIELYTFLGNMAWALELLGQWCFSMPEAATHIVAKSCGSFLLSKSLIASVAIGFQIVCQWDEAIFQLVNNSCLPIAMVLAPTCHLTEAVVQLHSSTKKHIPKDSSYHLIAVTIADMLYDSALWSTSLLMHMYHGDERRITSQFMSVTWNIPCLALPGMLSEYCEGYVLLLYQWDDAEFQLVHNCNLGTTSRQRGMTGMLCGVIAVDTRIFSPSCKTYLIASCLQSSSALGAESSECCSDYCGLGNESDGAEPCSPSCSSESLVAGRSCIKLTGPCHPLAQWEGVAAEV
jgi:hypothetical protein